MTPTDPRILRDLLLALLDAFRRVTQDVIELAAASKWLQSQINEQVQSATRTVRNAAAIAALDTTLANECDDSARIIAARHQAVSHRVNQSMAFAQSIQSLAIETCERCRQEIIFAEVAVQSAREELDHARSSLSICLQPVYVQGPNGQAVATDRDCSIQSAAVARAELALAASLTYLEDCRNKFARAANAHQISEQSTLHIHAGGQLIENATPRLNSALTNSDDAVRTARAEVDFGHQATNQVHIAERQFQQASLYERRCESTVGETNRINTAASTELSQRIERLEQYNRTNRLK